MSAEDYYYQGEINMKKITSLALAALLAVSLSYAVSAEAVSTDIKNGTPTLDGELDEIYTQSASYKLDNFGFYTWGDGSADNTSNATAYFLWDSDYLYICVTADDKTPSSAKGAGENNWQNDAAELWFLDEDLKFKIHAAADGNFFLGGDADGAVAWDKGIEGAKHSAKMTGSGWTVEVALPMNSLKAGKEFGFALQINDIYSPDYAASGAASGTQAPENTTMKLVADKVEVPAAAEEPAADDASSAATADMGIIASVSALAASALVIFRKKH